MANFLDMFFCFLVLIKYELVQESGNKTGNNAVCVTLDHSIARNYVATRLTIITGGETHPVNGASCEVPVSI